MNPRSFVRAPTLWAVLATTGGGSGPAVPAERAATPENVGPARQANSIITPVSLRLTTLTMG
jgi:hypothetical protein